MAVREFDGTDDQIQWAIDVLSGVTFGTFAAIFKPVTAASGLKHIFSPHNSGGTWQSMWLGYNGTSNRVQAHNGTDFIETAVDAVVDDQWHTVVMRKATGTTTARFSIYKHTATTWGHQNATAARGDWATGGSSGTIRTMSSLFDEFYQGRIAVSAVWSNEVHWSADTTGDSQIEAAGLEDSLQNWVDETPDALWAFNQDPLSAVNDLISNCDQSSVTGTTVVTGDDPPGFSFDLGEPAIPNLFVTRSNLQLR